MHAQWVEGLLAVTALALLGGYHLVLWRRVRRRPLATAFGLARYTRTRWVALVMAERRDILGVQTLRNWTMAATFLASTAMLIALGILSVAATTERAAEVARLLTFFGGAGAAFWQLKLLLLALGFLFAFFNFALALRYFNHAGFALALPADGDAHVTADDVAQGLNRGVLHYTLGMRAYYLAVPLALWLFGPELLLAAALVMVAILRGLDRP
jgi:uncharacterized membrane protein